MDFSDLQLDDLNQTEINESKQAEINAVVAESNKRLRIELQKVTNTKLVLGAVAPRIAKNPVTQEQYNCRLYALLNVIRNPEYTESRTPLADSWKDLYPHIPYTDRATNWKIGKDDKKKLVECLKEEGMYKYIELTKVRHFIDRVNACYLAKKVLKLEQRVKVLELQLSDNGNIWYKGIEIVKLSRVFKVTIGETVIETRHGTFDKLLDFLEQIDQRL